LFFCPPPPPTMTFNTPTRSWFFPALRLRKEKPLETPPPYLITSCHRPPKTGFTPFFFFFPSGSLAQLTFRPLRFAYFSRRGPFLPLAPIFLFGLSCAKRAFFPTYLAFSPLLRKPPHKTFFGTSLVTRLIAPLSH